MNTNVETKTARNEKMTPVEILFSLRYFLPILSTLGWILGFTLGHIPFFESLSLVIIGIGCISAFTVCPLKLLAFPFRCIAKCFTICRGFIPVYGVADLCAAVIGVGLGIMIGLAAILGLPAIFTIKKFLSDAE